MVETSSPRSSVPKTPVRRQRKVKATGRRVPRGAQRVRKTVQNWTNEENAVLISILDGRDRPYRWNDVARQLNNVLHRSHDSPERRTADQCSQHYNRVIMNTMKGSWTPKQDADLLASVRAYGSRSWCLVQEGVEGRTDSQCRNRFERFCCNAVLGKGRLPAGETPESIA